MNKEETEVKNIKSFNCTPPSQWGDRNSFGLLTKVNYEFDEKGFVNWRKLIKKEHLVFNKQKKDEIERVYGKKLDELSVDEVEDKYLLILLAGIKEIAQIRGYSSVDFIPLYVSDTFVSVKCTICWDKNYEVDKPVCFSDLADAHVNNTQSFAKMYLSTIAANRSFVRACRNFLKIHVVGADEVGVGSFTEESSVDQNPISPSNILLDKLKQKNITFGKLVNQIQAKIVKGDLKKEEFEGIEGWTEASQVPKGTILKMIDMIKKVEEKKVAKDK